MRLDQELVRRGLCESRVEAQELIEKGSVLLAGTVCTKKTRQVSEDIRIEVISRRQFVSRGGEKLQGVLREVFRKDENIHSWCAGKDTLDAGSSTGGFTDCLLSYGAKSVDAVDVGSNQIHTKIKDNKKVTVYENQDIRNFTATKKYDIVVADLSFISLGVVFSVLLSHGKNGSHFFLLIKPQFEVGKGNTKKGIVKNKELTDSVLRNYLDMCNKKSLLNPRAIPSSLVGGDGNQEYFLHFVLP